MKESQESCPQRTPGQRKDVACLVGSQPSPIRQGSSFHSVSWHAPRTSSATQVDPDLCQASLLSWEHGTQGSLPLDHYRKAPPQGNMLIHECTVVLSSRPCRNISFGSWVMPKPHQRFHSLVVPPQNWKGPVSISSTRKSPVLGCLTSALPLSRRVQFLP